jgi:hypothetical protein
VSTTALTSLDFPFTIFDLPFGLRGFNLEVQQILFGGFTAKYKRGIGFRSSWSEMFIATERTAKGSSLRQERITKL